jgi:hypothetical protein
MVAAVVEQGDALEREPVRAGVEQGYVVVVETQIETRELVGVLTGERPEPLGEREVVGREEVHREVPGPQADAVGVVGLGQPHAVVLRVDARLGVETDQAARPLSRGGGGQHHQRRVE